MRSPSALDQARNCPEVVEVAADARDLPAACAPWPAGARASRGSKGAEPPSPALARPKDRASTARNSAAGTGLRAATLTGQIRRPVVHQQAAALEQVRATVGGLDPVLDHVSQRRLDHLPKEGGRPLADPQLRQLVRENAIAAVPHGFRSSFRDWAAEETDWAVTRARWFKSQRKGTSPLFLHTLLLILAQIRTRIS